MIMYACRAWLIGSTGGLGKLVAWAGPGLDWLQQIAGCIELLPRLAPAFWQCHCLLPASGTVFIRGNAWCLFLIAGSSNIADAYELMFTA